METNTQNKPVDTSSAMLVSLRFTLCRQSVQLKEEAEGIEAKAVAEKGTVKASLFYFQKSSGHREDALAPLKAFMNEWRTEHKRLTRNWDGDNVRLLPAVLAKQYMEKTEVYKAAMPGQLNAFLAVVPQWIESAPQRMGALYAKSKFPTQEEIKADVGYDMAFMPLPESEQFKRISLISADLAKTMEACTTERVKKAVEEAQADTWNDVLKPIQHIITTLGKDKTKIYETLLGNVLSIVDLVPAFNLQNDPNLAALASEAKSAFAGISTDDLKKSDVIRKQVMASATTLVSAFKPFARKFNIE